MADLSEPYFNFFDLERICIDKVFFVVYDEAYAAEDHTFDKDLRDRFIQNVKRSRVQKGHFEQVLRKENQYSSWELRLKGARTMYFHVNVIHYLQYIHDIRPRNVIYDDNFMPIDCKLTALDYVAALRKFIDDAKNFYIETARAFWDIDLQKVQAKIAQIELPFEIYPASVDDISQKLYAKGVAFRKYNTQSGTIYLTSDTANNEIKIPGRKYDKTKKIDDEELTPTQIRPDIVYLNQINSDRAKNKIQIKIYQKTFGLCRIEFTIHSLDAKTIFRYDRLTDEQITWMLIQFIHFNLEKHDIAVDRYDRSLDDVVQFLAKALKEKEDLIYVLRDTDVFESSESNRTVRQRLVRKGILLKKYDSDGTQQRGLYLVNPLIRDFLNMYKETGEEHFVKIGLYPTL
jgi:hypothetical protein